MDSVKALFVRETERAVASPRLSKSRFVSGLQCLKRLWWEVHERDAVEFEPDPATQARMTTGIHVGAVARDYVPGGLLIDEAHNQYGRRIAATHRALDRGARVVYEAAFSRGNVFVAVDILERIRQGFVLTEVKSTTSVKDEHVPDVAVQAHVLRKAGLPVVRMEVMHLNRECRHPDLSNLFVREDVTDQVEERLRTVPRQVAAQLAALRGPLPDVEPGDHCRVPYECPFMMRCWEPVPPHHVSTLYRIGRRAAELIEQGYETIDELPDELRLNAVAARQARAVKTGVPVVEPGLAEVLSSLESPIAFLDFETVQPAIPVWPGCRPYDQVSAQLSCHVLGRRSGLAHHEWLADGPGDPRPEIAERLLDACRSAGTVLAWSSFEKQRIAELAEAVPHRAAELRELAARITDFLALVRTHFYHPDFCGSFSMKSVLPVLVPELSYKGMEVADGALATVELERLLLSDPPLDRAERIRLRAALLAYCHQDTLGMVRVLERLKALAGSDGSRRRGR